jgi:3'(2'), 5'-bisphosphate nucleotidase
MIRRGPDPESVDFSHGVEVAVEAVRAAALATEAVRRSGPVAIAKADASPVTIADYAAQAVVMDVLDQHLGWVPMVGEETGEALRSAGQPQLLDAVSAAARVARPDLTATRVAEYLDRARANPAIHAEGCWTLDPVDGTKGFLRGGQYAIALAYLEGSMPRMAAMACPRLGPESLDASSSHAGAIACAEWYRGARLVEWGGQPVHQVIARPRDWTRGDPVRLALSVESAHGDAGLAADLAAGLGPVVPPLRVDSCVKYLLVAQGRADAYLRIPSPGSTRAENVWDHAAGVLIALEAGCAVTDLLGQHLDFSRGLTLSANRGIVVAPLELHVALLAEVRRAHSEALR